MERVKNNRSHIATRIVSLPSSFEDQPREATNYATAHAANSTRLPSVSVRVARTFPIRGSLQHLSTRIQISQIASSREHLPFIISHACTFPFCAINFNHPSFSTFLPLMVNNSKAIVSYPSFRSATAGDNGPNIAQTLLNTMMKVRLPPVPASCTCHRYALWTTGRTHSARKPGVGHFSCLLAAARTVRSIRFTYVNAFSISGCLSL